MTHVTEPAPTPQPVRRRTLARILAGAALLILLVPVALKLYLASPQATRHLSRLLTDALRSPVTVAALEARGGTLVIRGLSVANPPGFSAVPLVAVDTLAVTPRWLGLLRGARGFSRIELDGARVVLEKNRAGVWNVAELQRGLPKKEAPVAETRIDELVIRAGAVTVMGRSIAGITLQLKDLATRGSAYSRLDLAFADGAGNHYRIEGSARPGPEPAFDLSLSAPSLNLAPFAGMLKRPEFSLDRGAGALRLRAALRGGGLGADGTMDFRNVTLGSAKASLPLGGRVELGLEYDLRRDEARLKNLTIALADLATVRAAATVYRARTERNFAADVSLDEMELGRLSGIAAAVTGRPLSLAGRLASRGLRISGDGTRGVTGIEGNIDARDLTVSLGGRPIVRGLAGAVSLAPAQGGFLAGGKLATGGQVGDALVERLDLPFTLLLSERFSPREVRVQSLAARIMGIPVAGSLGFVPAAPRPLVASLRVPAASLTLLAPHVARYGLRPIAGTTSLTLDLQGKGGADFDGEAAIRVDSLTAEIKGRGVVLGTGEVRSRFKRRGSRLEASGMSRLDGVEMDGKRGFFATSFGFSDRTLILADLRGRLAATAASAGRVTLTLPAGNRGAAPEPVPLSLEVADGAVRHGDADVAGVAASLRGNLRTDARGRWFEGEGAASAGRLAVRGTPVGAPSLKIAELSISGE